MKLPQLITRTIETQSCPVILPLALTCLLFATLTGVAWSTEIYETVPLAREVCTISILSEDIVICLDDEVLISAELNCGEDYLQVHDPQWFLDGEPVGTGTEILLSMPVGVYTLLVTCASCEDQIEITVLETCHLTPVLDALFADDTIETEAGIRVVPTQTPVTPLSFPSFQFLMRPFTLSAHEDLTSGYFELSTGSDNLKIFTLEGNQVSLPLTIDVTTLPLTFLINATANGDGSVIATHINDDGSRAIFQDKIITRATPLPGLAGDELSLYPHFQFINAINDNHLVQTTLDPNRFPARVGLPCRIYVTDHRTPAQWAINNTLTDVSGGYESTSILAGSITNNITAVWTSNLDPGDEVGKAYDVIYDFGLDGTLDPGDIIDGLSGIDTVNESTAGFYLVRDLNLPGPFNTTRISYSGGYWLGQYTYYPDNISSLGSVPLVVISHGNGHNYTWYDYLGYHLASYGFIVMSHTNYTGPGIESASTTTLTNTDYILGNQDTIGGGVLNGHIDSHRITWIGHSRGGEGVVRAFDRIHDHTYTPQNYSWEDIVCISSIAPTVYLNTETQSNPHEVNYHLITGAADGDVNGGVHDPDRQSLRLTQVARGNIQVTYVHGASHNDFNCCGWNDGTGPDLIGRPEAQRVAKSFYVALIKYYTEDNIAARDYLTRPYFDLHPSGIADHVIIANQYKDAVAAAPYMIDDYETHPGPTISSSGGAVTFTVSNLFEGRLDDSNTTFTWMSSDPMNGMSQCDYLDNFAGGVVFNWSPGDSKYYELEILSELRDFTDDAFLSFRACQGTRHPETVANDTTVSFTITLRDGSGHTSSIDIAANCGINYPYRRTGLGTGVGWGNEFNTIRIRLSDFTTDNTDLDLADIHAVRFEFGASFGSNRGRISLDDIEITQD